MSVSEVVKLPRTDGLHELSIQNLQQRPSKKLLPSLMNKGLPFKGMYKLKETAIVVHNSMCLTSLVTNQECTNLIQFVTDEDLRGRNFLHVNCCLATCSLEN